MFLPVLEIMERYATDPTWMKNEPLVNGMWNTILNHYFFQENHKFMIVPELHPQAKGSSSLAMDLGVVDIQTKGNELSFAPFLVFEGKSTTSGTLDEAFTQMKDWLKEQVLARGQCVWMVGAQGPKAMCYVYKRGQSVGDSTTIAAKYGSLPARIDAPENNNANAKIFDLTKESDRKLLDDTLEHMADNDPNIYTFVKQEKKETKEEEE